MFSIQTLKAAFRRVLRKPHGGKTWESRRNTAGYFKIRLQEDKPGIGTYIYIWETAQSLHPEKDYLQDSTLISMDICREDYGVPKESWKLLSS